MASRRRSRWAQAATARLSHVNTSAWPAITAPSSCQGSCRTPRSRAASVLTSSVGSNGHHAATTMAATSAISTTVSSASRTPDGRNEAIDQRTNRANLPDIAPPASVPARAAITSMTDAVRSSV